MPIIIRARSADRYKPACARSAGEIGGIFRLKRSSSSPEAVLVL